MTIAIAPTPAHASSTSPLRSSPLTGQRSPPRSPLQATGVPIPKTPRPRTSLGASPHTPSSSTPLSRSAPLLGSFPLSLLHARMSAHAPHSVGADRFSLRIKAVATAKCCPDVRAPPALVLPVAATYYDLVGEGDVGSAGCAAHSPWVADVDLESHFFAAYGPDEEGSGTPLIDGPLHAAYTPSPPRPTPRLAAGLAFSPASTSPSSPLSLRSPSRTLPPPPSYPGYRVPPVGQLQILVNTPTAAVHAFVLPYDLRSLPIGGRLLARERTYVAAAEDAASPGKRRESLRYAVQLQFVCAPAPGEADDRAFYVARTIKLVFTSRAPEASLSQRTERADELVLPTPATSGRGHARTPSLSSPGRDWARTRGKWLARRAAETADAKAATAERNASAKARSAAVRGFSPGPERPRSPAPPVASPRSLLSALKDDPSRGRGLSALSPSLSAGVSPGTSPVASTGVSPSPSRSSSRGPVSVAGGGRRRGSRVERELSARLRALEVKRDDD